MFKAKYECATLLTKKGRFLITKILANTTKWNEFDEDRMSIGSRIAWSLHSVTKIACEVIPEVGSEAQQVTPLVTPRGKRSNPDNWERNVKKRKLNSGDAYNITNKRGKTSVKKGKAPKPPCGPKCRNKCTTNDDPMTEVERDVIFYQFWALGDIDLQRCFIINHVKSEKKKRQRIRYNVNKSGKFRVRESTRTYYLTRPNTSEKVKVCSKYFLSTLDIDEKRVRTALDKLTNEGVMQRDKRGKHNHQRTVKLREKRIIKHICTFKAVESHYVRKTSKYQYLPDQLSCAVMHRLYVEECQKKKIKAEDYKFYNHVFNRYFNLKFQKPKKDRCDKCFAYEHTLDESKTPDLIAQHTTHLNDKNLARSYKNELKLMFQESDDTIVIAFDLEKVLLCPHAPSSSFYYSRRLKIHNLTFTNINNMETTCYVWSELEAKKGSCEIGTCFMQYCEVQANKGIRTLHSFSDRCGGQANNRMVVLALMEAMIQYKFKDMSLNFLVSGHSQNENDNAHSVIEGFTRKKSIYTPLQWEDTIEEAFKTNTCIVNRITHSDIINLKSKEAFPEYALLLKVFYVIFYCIKYLHTICF